MSNKNYNHRANHNSKHNYYEDDFEDYGYEVKNLRRQTKRKVQKFKDVNDYDDSYWSVTHPLVKCSKGCHTIKVKSIRDI